MKVGIVIVSHSAQLSQCVADMVKQMVGEPSNDLIRYYEWRAAQDAAGQPSSIEAYIAYRDKEFNI